MFAFTAFLALAALAQAAPVAQKDAPSSYLEGYLEPYMTYHTRYIEIGCAGKQGSQFFTDCCSPMLSTETLEDARLPYCRPNVTESASVSSSAAPVTQTASADIEAQSAYAQAVTSEAAAASSTKKAEATTTWSAQPEATSEAPAQSSGDNQGGFATYFYQGGNPGACGNYHSDGEKGVAIDSAWWPNFSSPSEHCGKWVTITNTNTGATTTAQIWDVCPTCTNGNSLDLSVGAFTAIASESDGMVPISWSFN